MIGRTVSHYRILEKLGEGGMGVVYRAHDTRLDRDVALKFLPPELTRDPAAKERFMHEAQAASALDHPNICTVYEIDETADGRMFISMAYYNGESLQKRTGRGTPALDETLDIITQAAQGLARAHERGIVHRDLKPANIILTSDGVVKILDFGLAKLRGQTRLTRAGTTLGTAAYLSPEQARGEDVDHRTDIWSLGVVMYELLTGRLPFRGEHEQAVIYLILNQNPEPPVAPGADVPDALQRIVARALEKDPARRYQDLRTLVTDLHTQSAPADNPSRGKKSIVVLPFEDISPGRDNEYFSDGLTEEIITDLSKIDQLRVISRNSAMVLKGTRKPTKTIGRELNVQYVLEGSVRKAGTSLRITAQLIDALNDAHVWAEKYSGTLEDVFDIQERVSRAIVGSLKLQLTPEQDRGVAERPIPDVHAYDCYLRAKRVVELFTEDGLEQALRYLRAGLDIAGENAVLYAGMGYVYWQYVNIGIKQEDYLEKMADCIRRVFKLDPRSAQGHMLLGLSMLFSEGQQQSVRHLKKALAANPHDPHALTWLATAYSLAGRLDAAAPLVDRLMEIDPLNSFSYVKQGVTRYYEGRFDGALDSLLRAHRMEPNNPAGTFWVALLLGIRHRAEEAISFVAENIDTTSRNVFVHLSRFLSHALLGDNDLSCVMTDDFASTCKRDCQYSCFVADFYALLGLKEESLEWLENAVDRGFIHYPFLQKDDPFLQNVRCEDRFGRLMERVKKEWEEFEV